MWVAMIPFKNYAAVAIKDI
jgi:transposase InsO family protein